MNLTAAQKQTSYKTGNSTSLKVGQPLALLTSDILKNRLQDWLSNLSVVSASSYALLDTASCDYGALCTQRAYPD